MVGCLVCKLESSADGLHIGVPDGGLGEAMLVVPRYNLHGEVAVQELESVILTHEALAHVVDYYKE